MRLTVQQVERVAAIVLERLKARHLVVFKAPEKAVLDRMVRAMLDDLRAEEKLDREVEEILSARLGPSGSGGIDYRKMFTMVKTKLARERGIIL